MTILHLLTLLYFGLVPSPTFESKGWRGIQPLVSARTEVERLLGPCPQRTGSSCVYDTDRETIVVSYSDGVCEKGWPFGYNVPVNTVIRIEVSPTNYVRVTDILSNLERYDKRIREDGSVMYVDDQEGFAVEVFEGKVGTMIYGSTTKQAHLRCPDSPEVALPKGTEVAGVHSMLLSYGEVQPQEEIKYLGGFAKLLKQQATVQGYIITYGGQLSFPNEALSRLDCQRTYLIRGHGIDPDRITTIDGGYRSTRTVELYVLPKGGAVPVAFPTVRPSRVEIIKRSESSANILSPCSQSP